MRTHRFYFTDEPLVREFWINNFALVNQWRKVLRMNVGDELVLFDGETEDRLYKIIEAEDGAVKLQLVTELHRQVPAKDLHLCWALLKKDKNEWVLQKGTELGVRVFAPIITERTEKTGFDEERARKIVIEAAEQCGRSDIPVIREPITVQEAIGTYADQFPLFICEQDSEPAAELSEGNKLGVLIGPEGGWSDSEKALFKEKNLPHLQLSDMTLRAETAAIAAVTQLMIK